MTVEQGVPTSGKKDSLQNSTNIFYKSKYLYESRLQKA